MLSRVIDNTFCYNLDNKDMLREVTVKISLERIDTQKEITVKALLDSEQWSYEFRIYKEVGVSIERNRKIYICEKCR